MLPHIQSATDLITSRASTREGFLKQAFAKTRKAAPYINQANHLANYLETINDIDELANVDDSAVKLALIASAGFSDKARGQLTEPELASALAQVLEHIKNTAPQAWRQELVYRFLLTRGDTLGGSMRNATGAEGGAQLSRAIVSALTAGGKQHTIFHSRTNSEKVVSVAWEGRQLVFDKKPAFINNNVDAILLEAGTAAIESPANYLACGELKGGIDPAGADEHWKTAQSAFVRIRRVFLQQSLIPPPLFFVGAAIEAIMADQIFAQLQSGDLTYAANLTVAQQVSNIADWLIAL